MIQAYAGDLLMIGVTRGNIEKLTAGQPIFVAELHRPVRALVIVFGETKPDVIAAVERATSIPFEESHKAAAMEDPT